MIGYGLIILTLIITLSSQGYIKSVYNKISKISAKTNITGSEAARRILDKNGLKNVDVVEVQGELNDHYDPRSKTIRLSTKVYKDSSLASISVASHECGHAIQDKDGYAFLRIRNTIVPMVNLASRAGYIVIMIGILASITSLIWVGIVAEAFILLFQLVTLPVEFNASNRGLKNIEDLTLVENDEFSSCKKVLKAAALTYVASAAAAVLDILRLILIVTRRD